MIRVRGLTKRFGEVEAITDISFDVAPGEILTLLGPNGSGKTTTLKCIVGLDIPSAGDIAVDGIDLVQRGREARERLSYLPQRVRLPDSLTARETLRFYSRLRKLPATSADSLIESSDVQLKGFADRPVGEFSGGMVQRLGVAVALLPDAPVLVLDEPTASLDPEGALALRNLLGSLKRRGKAVLFSTHLLADVEQIADRVAIIVGGRLAAVEPVEDLQRDLLERVVLRVSLTNAEEKFAEVALRAGAREARLEGVTLLITSSAHSRLRILRAIEEPGGNIERFATDEPLIEEFYLRYVNAKTVDR